MGIRSKLASLERDSVCGLMCQGKGLCVVHVLQQL